MNPPRSGLITCVVALAAIATAFAPVTTLADEPGRPDAFRRVVLPLLERYCTDCHSKEDAEAGIVLDRHETGASATKDGATWLRVRDALEARLMPPSDERQPSAKELDALIGWIEDDVLAAGCREGKAPAPVAIRRLNRQEYNRTIRDLIGLDLRLADAFPADEIGFGFDNVGSALNVSPAHVEKYLDAAELAMDKAIVAPDAEGFPPVELIGGV